jgi:hypothetical protein
LPDVHADRREHLALDRTRPRGLSLIASTLPGTPGSGPVSMAPTQLSFRPTSARSKKPRACSANARVGR